MMAKPIPYDDDAPEDEETEMWIDASDNEAPFLAQHWYSGQGDPLYALASAGFPQPESTVSWALKNAKESETFQWKEMEKKYGKKGIQKLIAIDPESREARALPQEKREDLEATDEISRLVYALQEALDHGERISKADGWAQHGKTRESRRGVVRAPGGGGGWTVEPGRNLYYNGTQCFSLNREGQTEPVVADGAAHVIADLFNREGVTPDSVFKKHMGFPKRKR